MNFLWEKIGNINYNQDLCGMKRIRYDKTRYIDVTTGEIMSREQLERGEMIYSKGTRYQMRRETEDVLWLWDEVEVKPLVKQLKINLNF